MLTALNSDGSLICLADHQNRQSLLHLREKEKFYCPRCKEGVILKIGSKKVSHFAHYKSSSCSEQYERESAYHLLGKQQLYLWLKEQGFQPELEAYDEVIKQRPDIRFTFQNIRYAVEYQCSTIPDESFIKRTRNYLQHQYFPIWILGGHFFTRKGNGVVSLSDFQYLTITSTNNQSSLTFYCPNANQMIFLRQIFPISIRNAMASISIKPLNNLNVPEFISPHNHGFSPLSTWQKEMKTFKQFYSQKPQSFRDPFLKELYLNRLHFALLPPEIGLPVSNSIFIRTPPAVWQGYLYLDCFKNRSQDEAISLNTINQAFQKRVWKKQISLRELAMLNGDASLAVQEYLKLLTACGYLTKISATDFTFNYELKSARNMVEQERMELSFYQKNKSSIQFFR
ncbi:competence protein CoiA [Neobacillus sp. LXY-4]|uniref:competence protein CoiA n=1 Tax=Neobacillus sp. LXY-4 TaxID=3379826 RepID=UPI003EE26D49